MARERVAIVGASARAAAQSAVAAGFDVAAADLFADADLRSVCPATRIERYPDGLADWLGSQTIDAWFYTGALENYPDLVDRMAAIAPLWGVAGAALRHARDPLRLAEICSGHAVAFPETVPIERAPLDPIGWLAKTYRHSSGAGVQRLADERPAGAFAQREINGKPMAALFAVSSAGAVLLGLTERPAAGPLAPSTAWGYLGSIGPIDPSPALDGQLRRIGETLVALKLRGVVGVDLVVDGDSPWVVEINPRYTASAEVLERATGRSVVAAHAEACGGAVVEPFPPAEAWAKLVYYAPDTITISPGFARWALEQSTLDRLSDAPPAGQTIAGGRPVCTLLTPRPETLPDRVEELVARLSP